VEVKNMKQYKKRRWAMKIPETIERFKQYMMAKNFSERTIEAYANVVKLFDIYLQAHGIKNVKKIGRDIVSKYQIDLTTKNRYTKTNLSVVTQIGRMVGLISYFKFLYGSGIINMNPISHIELPRVPRRPPANYMTFKEVLTLLKAVDGTDYLSVRDRAILELLCSVGLRNTELRTLKITDVDFNNNLIKIYGKGGKERIIPIGNVALDYLQEYINRSRPFMIKNDAETLFLSHRGKRLSIDSLPDIINKYRGKTNITKRIGAHTFRHTFATHLLLKGIDLRSLQELLGHNSIETTQIYMHLNLKDLKAIYAKTHPRENDLV